MLPSSVNSSTRRIRTALLAGLLVLGVTACGDDDNGDDPVSTEADSGDNGGDSGGADSANPDVQAYCDQVDDLAEQLEEVLADPSSGDAAALTVEAQELVTAAANLISANPDDVDEINACSARLQSVGQ